MKKQTYIPIIEASVANKAFADTITKQDNGSNSYLPEFIRLAENLLHRPTFCLDDLLYENRPLELPLPIIKEYWDKWTTQLVLLGKLSRIEGCYSTPIFVVQ